MVLNNERGEQMIQTDSLIAYVPWSREWPRFDAQYNLVTTVPATSEPVSYDDMADHMRLDQTDDQSLVTALAIAGRIYVETYTKLTLIQTTYQVSFDTFDYCTGLKLPHRPVVSGTISITYIDQSGNTQTLSPSLYAVDTKSVWTRIRPASNQTWPQTQAGTPNAVTITFTAGTSTTAAGVSELAKLAIKSWAAAQYENREAVNTGKTARYFHTRLIPYCRCYQRQRWDKWTQAN